MRYQDVPDALRAAAPFGVAELAERAGMSRPTLYRILAGSVPRVDDLRELALACGLQLEFDLVQLSDPMAGVAARLEFGDTTVDEWASEAADWTARLTRFADASGGEERGTTILREAGRAGAPRSRAGAVHLKGDHRAVDRLVSAGRATAQRWALSGWAALDAMGVDVDSPTIMWVEDARATTQLLSDTFRPARQGGGDLIVVPAHPSVFAGAAPLDDVELVAPLQAFLDAIGLRGAAEELALAHVGGQR